MKHHLLMVALLGLTNAGVAQQLPVETPGAESIHSVKAAVLGLAYSYEKALSPRTTANVELMLAGVIEGGSGRKINLYLAPIIIAEPRYYYSLIRRAGKQKNTTNNSANYLALTTSYVFGSTIGDRIRFERTFSAVPKWGLRRALGSRFFFETAIGIGVSKPEHYGWRAAPELNVKFGFSLSKRAAQ